MAEGSAMARGKRVSCARAWSTASVRDWGLARLLRTELEDDGYNVEKGNQENGRI